MTNKKNKPHGYALLVEGQVKAVTDTYSDGRYFAQFYSDAHIIDIEIKPLETYTEYITSRLQMAEQHGQKWIERVILEEANRIQGRQLREQQALMR